MSIRLEKKCYDLILQSGLVEKDNLDRLFVQVEENDISLTKLVINEGLAKESDLLELYSKKMKAEIINLKKIEVDEEGCRKVPVKFAWYYRFFPYHLEGNTLTIAVSRLVDVNYIDEVRFGIGMDVTITLASDRDVEAMLQKHYGVGSDTVDQILTQSSSEGKTQAEPVNALGAAEIEDIDKSSEDASVIKIVNQILLDGYKRGASDIHFEPMRGKMKLRYRIDGVMHDAATPAQMHSFISSIVSRIKIMANLNVIEKRIPQDGKARVKTQEQNLDLRVSTIPTPHGESIVIRILPSQMVKGLKDLGLEPSDVKVFKELIERPHGIIFVTGPTGSGKSTTLYAGLSCLNQEKKKLITIEDPIEYEVEGITQIQVSPQLGLTFASGLRSVLRHDPDVMMVGEVRDLETADIAIRIALTGHLILSTLHTNDAASGVTRLLDIGIEPYLISSSVIAFMAQRLVRVICPHCKREDIDTPDEVFEMIRREMQLDERAEIKTYVGIGCDECHQTGFAGRVAIYEILKINENLRKLIFEGATSERIKNTARKQGMMTMRQRGWEKVLEGVTTADEVLHIAPADESITHELIPVPLPKRAPTPVPEEDEKIVMTGQELRHLEEGEVNPYVERRAYTRVITELPLKYRIIDLDKRSSHDEKNEEHLTFLETVTDDMSANGLSFSIRVEMLPGQVLDMRVQLPNQTYELQCIGRIMRIIKTLDKVSPSAGFVYQVGVTFLAINSTDRAKIETFCQSRLQS